jgi:phage gp16-like protein
MKIGDQPIGKREYAIIHIAAKALGLSDDVYRDLLQALFGARTSKGLTFRQYRKLMDRFQADGYRWYGRKRKTPFVQPPAASWDKAPMLKKIAAILGNLGLQWHYADGIAKHMFGIDAVLWCAPEQLHKVIAALEYRVRARPHAHADEGRF